MEKIFSLTSEKKKERVERCRLAVEKNGGRWTWEKFVFGKRIPWKFYLNVSKRQELYCHGRNKKIGRNDGWIGTILF